MSQCHCHHGWLVAWDPTSVYGFVRGGSVALSPSLPCVLSIYGFMGVAMSLCHCHPSLHPGTPSAFMAVVGVAVSRCPCHPSLPGMALRGLRLPFIPNFSPFPLSPLSQLRVLLPPCLPPFSSSKPCSISSQDPAWIWCLQGLGTRQGVAGDRAQVATSAAGARFAQICPDLPGFTAHLM